MLFTLTQLHTCGHLTSPHAINCSRRRNDVFYWNIKLSYRYRFFEAENHMHIYVYLLIAFPKTKIVQRDLSNFNVRQARTYRTYLYNTIWALDLISRERNRNLCWLIDASGVQGVLRVCQWVPSPAVGFAINCSLCTKVSPCCSTSRFLEKRNKTFSPLDRHVQGRI